MSQSMDLDKIQPRCFMHRASPGTAHPGPSHLMGVSPLMLSHSPLIILSRHARANISPQCRTSTHHVVLSNIFSSLYHIFYQSQQLWPAFHSLSYSVFLYQLFCFYKSSAKCVFVHLSFSHSCHSQLMPQRMPIRHPLHTEHMPILQTPAISPTKLLQEVFPDYR